MPRWTAWAPSTGVSFALPADGVVHAQAVHLVRGDVSYGSVVREGESFMSRERAPFRGDVDLDDLDEKGWKRYAEICGRLLAHAHALSDELGELDEDVEPLILEAAGPTKLFVEDMLAFGAEAAARARAAITPTSARTTRSARSSRWIHVYE